jgi:DnaJ-class molecular chaperone
MSQPDSTTRPDDDWDNYADPDDLDCTFCGGDGLQENDDPLWYGSAHEVPCVACNGTGLRKHQTIF